METEAYFIASSQSRPTKFDSSAGRRHDYLCFFRYMIVLFEAGSPHPISLYDTVFLKLVTWKQQHIPGPDFLNRMRGK